MRTSSKDELIDLIEDDCRYGLAFDDATVRMLRSLTRIDLCMLHKAFLETRKMVEDHMAEKNDG